MAQESLFKRFQVPLICAVLILLVIAAFEPVRHNGFVDYDDQTYILFNYHIHPGITADSVKWAFTSGYASNWHPLTWLSHMIDIELFELNPLGHHLHNLALHIAVGVLLFLILRNLTGALWPSAFVAAVFAVHPLRAESVVWAAERKDVLCLFWGLLSIAAYIGYARRGGVFRYLLVVLCFCLGLMAKPMIVTLPLVLLLLDFWPLGRIRINSLHGTMSQAEHPHSVSIVRLLAEKIPLLVLVAVSSIVTYRVQSASGSVDVLSVSFFGRMTNACVSYAKYLFKMAWPTHLAVLYPFPEEGWPMWQSVTALVVLLALTILAVCTIRKRSWLFVGWFWYLITMVPVIGLVQIGAHEMADRYSYFPSIGILLMAVWTVYDMSAGRKYRGLIWSIAGGVFLFAMLSMTRTQVTYWKDSITLNKHTVAVTQNNYTAYNNLGIALINEKKYDEASFYLQKSLEIRPDYYLANTNMAHLMKELKHYDEALAYTNRAIKTMPQQGLAYFIRGRILADMGRHEEAIEAYKTAARLDPDDFRPFYDAGVLLAKKDRFDAAIEYLKQCVRINPTWGNAWRDMGLAQQRLGLIEEALASYRIALKLIARDYVTCYRTAVCFEQIGHPRDAINFYRQAVTFKPDFSQAMDKLAWMQSTSPVQEVRNPTEALVWAQKANQIAGQKNYWILDTLAAAYAARGQFKEAVQTAGKAISMAQAKNDTAAVEVFTTRIQLYQKDLPYIDQPLPQVQTNEPAADK